MDNMLTRSIVPKLVVYLREVDLLNDFTALTPVFLWRDIVASDHIMALLVGCVNPHCCCRYSSHKAHTNLHTKILTIPHTIFDNPLRVRDDRYKYEIWL